MGVVIIITRTWLTDSFLERLGPTSPKSGLTLFLLCRSPHLHPTALTPPPHGREACKAQKEQSDNKARAH